MAVFFCFFLKQVYSLIFFLLINDLLTEGFKISIIHFLVLEALLYLCKRIHYP